MILLIVRLSRTESGITIFVLSLSHSNPTMNQQTSRPLGYFLIESPVSEVFAQIFAPQDDGRLRFGFSATSMEACDQEELKSGADFRDYILEGFVRYRLRLEKATLGTMLGVGAYDENRRDAISPAIRHYLRTAQVDAIEMALADPPPSTL